MAAPDIREGAQRCPSHPAFAALAPLLGCGLASLTIDRLNELACTGDPPPCSDTGEAIRFVATHERLSALEYESRILATGRVATRPDAVHDILNALCWLAFPRTKRACNRLHVAYADATRSDRGGKRDAVTLVDESGIIALCADDALGELLRDRQWKTLFVEMRQRATAGLRFFVCGHALYEKLLDPYPGITGRVLIVEVPTAAIESDTAIQRATADAAAVELLQNAESPAAFPPLPLAGIPGWDPRNESPSFYDNRKVFRAS